MLILEQFFWIPVENIFCGIWQLCQTPKVSGKRVINLVFTQFRSERYFLLELVEWDTGRMITQQQLLMSLIVLDIYVPLFISIGGDF